MPGGELLRVVLELESADPIRGTIVGPDDERQPFYGWLELAAALGRVRPPKAAIAAPDQTTALGDRAVSPEPGQI